MVGDKIISVNGNKYIGQANFFGQEHRTVSVEFTRKSENHNVQIKLNKRPMYRWYSNAVQKSAHKFEQGGLKLGYVHLWCGGKPAQDAMQEALDDDPIKECDGLILDLRDGYGACSPDALDPFYRQPAAYPDFETITRSGKKSTSTVVYNKPMVAIINGGSRSGKEELAYSLKNTKRALVLGDRTAGYFLAGSILPINEKCFLYLAVLDCSLSGVRLEGTGVEPDLSVQNDKTSAFDQQLETAKDELAKRIKEAKKSESKSEKDSS
jgi:carboxyl-terminal processing protease